MWLLSTLSGLVLVCSLVSAVQVDIVGLGSVNGKEDIARDGTRYYSFLGIPYLEPPLADLRFKPGVPAKPWSGVRDATKFGNKCIQFNMYGDESPGEPVGSEDCLFINVFTKSTSVTAKKPVIFWIHGGAFIFGGVSGFGAKYMLEQDVVFVTVQYRLGVFGFLSTEDKNAPGNYGLHDQQAGLQWVQDHIHHFGGDKDKVNIMGCSAGGASVHYHLLSPRAAGLFNGAVSMSGSALCWWANLPNQRI
ncbi:esterase FE4, partial [Eurytemora carolleeae]|uniref:esterase FE4 n=1 Tax=Eurytemora carolleeae TaxID=1294199 RepID=UPI000C772361